jgi:hypothetical protein
MTMIREEEMGQGSHVVSDRLVSLLSIGSGLDARTAWSIAHVA